MRNLAHCRQHSNILSFTKFDPKLKMKPLKNELGQMFLDIQLLTVNSIFQILKGVLELLGSAFLVAFQQGII